MVITLIDIVDSDYTAILPMKWAASFTATNAANILVIIPHVVTTDTAIATLNEDAAASSLVPPTISSRVGSTRDAFCG